ncbi:MAG: class I SAM-dependent methyltransferase [Phycisphaeraceae bacterium]|nr:class I SAM-dependent methyltransferase [Phycisphaeraceae bacterium]
MPFQFRGKGLFRKIAPRQNIDEIKALYENVCQLRPKRVLEIGTARGGSLYLWAQASMDDATIVSVDLPGGKYGGGYPESKTPFYQSFARSQQKLHLQRADSHSPQTLQIVNQIFNGEQLDFLFIDGDHTYEGVKTDFLQYSQLVRPGGIIGLHDILHRPDDSDIHVDRFWNELKIEHQTQELIGGPDSGRTIGIGLVHVPQ